jgi:hypothetical protein
VAQNLRARLRTLSENMAVSEVNQRMVTIIRVMSESLGMTESLAAFKGFVRTVTESVGIVHFTGRLKREGFVRIRRVAKLFRRGQSAKTYKRGGSVKGADR